MINLSRKTGCRKTLGQGITEYIIIVVLIAIAAIGIYSLFGQTVRQQTAGMLPGTEPQTAGAQAAAKSVSGEAAAKKGVGDYSSSVNK